MKGRVARWAHAAAVLSSLLLVACTAPNLDCPFCAAPDEDLAALSGRAFLIHRLTFRDSLASDPAAGLDLDGHDAGHGSTELDASCEEFNADAISSLDPRITGVDNAGRSLIWLGEGVEGDQTFQGELDRAVTEGRIRWAIAIGEAIDDGTWSRVRVTVHVIDADQTIATAGGVPVADQSLSSRPIASFDLSVAGHVAFGLTEVSGSELDVTGHDVFLLPFDDFVLGGVGFDASVGPERLIGVLGGSFSVDALLDITVRTASISAEDAQRIRRTVEFVADLQPSRRDPAICERVSAGFGFEAVPVVLN